jgi:hypothetical protein|tara:strand:+ start:216 stop:434 length:219 start_codon:yes stop_codon:yes gene_type:complete
MIILENISTGEVFNGNEIEYFIDDDTHIGEVYLDGDLVFQSLEVINDDQLEHALNKEFKVLKETSDSVSDFN